MSQIPPSPLSAEQIELIQERTNNLRDTIKAVKPDGHWVQNRWDQSVWDEHISWGEFEEISPQVLELCDQTANLLATLDTERAARVRAEEEVANLKQQLTYQRDNNHKRNLALDALHFVWCNGGCKGGTHRWQEGEVTLEIVKAAIANTRRLVTWFINARYRAYPNYPKSLMPEAEIEALRGELDVYGAYHIAELERERDEAQALLQANNLLGAKLPPLEDMLEAESERDVLVKTRGGEGENEDRN